MPDVRPAAVAGMFYPGAPAGAGGRGARAPRGGRSAPPRRRARAQGDHRAARRLRLFRARSPAPRTRGSRPRARRSGASCCSARRTACRSAGSRCRRSRAFATPLGDVAVDREAAADLALTLPQVITSDAAHALEHSLEVQLPFLQSVLGELRDRPVRRRRRDAGRGERGHRSALGRAGDALRRQLRSLALPPVRRRARQDRATGEAILALSATLDHERGVRRDADQRPARWRRGAAGSKPELLDLRNSGDTAGDKSRVVGYASFAFAAPDPADGRP